MRARTATAIGTIAAIGVGSIAVSLPFPTDLTASTAAAIVLGIGAAWRPHRGIAAFLLTGLLAGSLEHWLGANLRFFDEIGILALTAVILTVHRRSLRIPRPGLREAGLALVVAAGLLSSLVNDVPSGVWLPALGLLLKAFALFYVVLVLPVSRAELAAVSSAFLLVGGVIVAIGLAQYVFPEATVRLLALPNFEQERGGLRVVNSVFTHPALYGWLAAFLGLFLYARAVVTRSPWTLPIAVLMSFASVLSGRRTPIVGTAAGLVLGAVRQVTGGVAATRVWLAVGAAGVLVVLVSLPLLGDFYRSTLVEYGERTDVMAEVFDADPDSLVLSTLQPRIALYLGSVAIARDELPLGAGLGRFGSHMSREVYSPAYEEYGLERIWGLAPHVPHAVTDTFWPMILGETGVVGLLGMLGFLGAVGVGLWRASAAADPAVRTFTLGALIAFGETLVRSLTSSVFLAPPIALVALSTFALALAASRDGGDGAAASADGAP